MAMLKVFDDIERLAEDEDEDEPRCRVCGCTEADGCSRCAWELAERRRRVATVIAGVAAAAVLIVAVADGAVGPVFWLGMLEGAAVAFVAFVWRGWGL